MGGREISLPVRARDRLGVRRPQVHQGGREDPEDDGGGRGRQEEEEEGEARPGAWGEENKMTKDVSFNFQNAYTSFIPKDER